MQLFISWSGQPSRSYALAFREWIGDVFQSVQPFMSEVDIDAGEPWLSAIQDRLSESDFGVAFVTANNVSSQWMHYEAGAIAKTVGRSRLIPVLCDLDHVSLPSPMNLFQAKRLDRNGLFDVCKAVNIALGQTSLKPEVFNKAFNQWWPALELVIQNINPEISSEKPELQDPVRIAVDRLSERVGNLARANEQLALMTKQMLELLAVSTSRRERNALSIIARGTSSDNSSSSETRQAREAFARTDRPSGRGLGFYLDERPEDNPEEGTE